MLGKRMLLSKNVNPEVESKSQRRYEYILDIDVVIKERKPRG